MINNHTHKTSGDSPEGYTHSRSLLNLSVFPQQGLTGLGVKGWE